MHAKRLVFLPIAALAILGACSHARRVAIHPAAEALPENDAVEWYLKRRVGEGATDLPADVYNRAREHLAGMPRYSVGRRIAIEDRAAAAHTWTSAGPGNIGARTRSFVINPQNPNIMYAGAVTGGVFKTTDGGATWDAVTDSLPVINIGALALDPNNPDIIYAGTGESAGAFPGVGIFKSTDAGATWTLLGKPAQSGAFTYITKIAVSANNSQHLYAATRNGLYASQNGGATWGASAISATYYGCTDMAIRADQPTDYLFAVCSGTTSSQTFSVWRNTDAGGAGVWTNVFTTTNMSNSVIAIAASQPSTIYLAAASAAAGFQPRDTAGLVGIFRSTSNGDAGSWVEQDSGTNSNPFDILLFAASHSNTTSWCSSGGTYTGSTSGTWSRLFAVDPVNPNTVWIGGVDLYRSDDGGVTWGVASAWDLQTLPSYSHADRHLLVFHPQFNGGSNQTAFQLTDGGIFRTDNARATISTGSQAGCQPNYQNTNQLVWTHIDRGYVGTQFYHGAAYPGGSVYFGGSQDNGVERGADSTGVNGWATLIGGDGGATAVDPVDVNHLFGSYQNLSLQRSTDGATFVTAISGITETYGSFPFIAYLATDPNEGKRAFLGGSSYLWRSLDGGVSWTAAATTGSSGAVSAITVSPFDANTVFYGTSNGFIARSSVALTTAASTWTAVQPRTGNVAGIAFDPTNPNILYATYSTLKGLGQAHVYRSTDGGATWTPSDGAGATAVPDTPVWRILVDPHTPTTLYLGTDLGLLVSTDSGGTWAQDPGLPTVVIEELSFDASNNWLFAYTYGRGTFKTPLNGAGSVTCTYSVNPPSVTSDRFGGVFPVAVTAPAGCGWSAFPATASSLATVQSPAQGTGNGTAYVVLAPNINSGAVNTNVIVAGIAVPVSEAAQSFQNIDNDQMANAPAITVPAMIRIDTRSATSSAGDPIQSCTGSADYKTVWWKVTPAASGYLNALVRGDRLDVFGDFGIVVTAYPQSNLGQELGCATVPKNNNARTTTSISFAVTGGVTYLIEVATSGGNTAQDGGNANLVLTNGSAPAAVTVTPSQSTVPPGGAPKQFSAQVSNAANTAVRWSVTPPIGILSPSGAYTPPSSVAGATTVTISAASFADPTKSGSATVTIAALGVCDVNSDGLVDVHDVQQMIGRALGMAPSVTSANVTTVQLVMNSALSLGCGLN